MRILWRVLILLKKYWKWLILTYVCLLALTAATMIVPIFIGDAVNNALHYNADTLKVTGDMKLLVFYGIAIIILTLTARTLLFPLAIPSIRSIEAMREVEL